MLALILFGSAIWLNSTPTKLPPGSVPVTKADFKYDKAVQMARTGDAQLRGQALAELNALIDTSAEGLSEVYVEGVLVPSLLAIADKKISEESRAALMALGKLLDHGMPASEAMRQQVQDFLVDLVSDSRVYVDAKSPAILSLRDTLPLSEQNIEALFRTLEGEPMPYVKQEIASTLVYAARSQSSISDRLHALASGSAADDTKAAIISALKFDSKGSESTGAVFSKGLESTNPQVRWKTMDAMMAQFRSASRSDVVVLASIVNNQAESERNRRLAVEVLGRIGSTKQHPQAVQTLRATALSPNIPVQVRERAVRSVPFAMNYSNDARTFLNQFMASDEAEIVEAATWGLRVVEERQQGRREAIGNN